MPKMEELSWYVFKDLLSIPEGKRGRAYVAVVDTFDYVPDVSEYEGVVVQGCNSYDCEETHESDLIM